MASGTHASTRHVSVNTAGAMPTTVCGTPSSVIVLSSSERDPPSRCHSRSLITTTLGAPGRSSSSVNQRPASGGAAMTRKKDADARAPPTRSADSRPVMVMPCGAQAPVSSKTRLRARQST